MGSTLFRDPQALSSALTALGTLQPRVFGSLNRVDPLDSVSNYYVEKIADFIVIGLFNPLQLLLLQYLATVCQCAHPSIA